MSRRPSHGRCTFLPALAGLILLIAGVSLLLLGVVSLWRHRQGARSRLPHDTLTPPAMPAPITATEPILPPPPTTTSSPTLPLTSANPTPIQLSPSSTLAAPILPTLTPWPLSTTSRGLYTLRQRLGVGSGQLPVTRDIADRLGFGWYLDWTLDAYRFRAPGLEYVPTIRVKEGWISTDGKRLLPTLSAAVDALPGALWLIGNEPDVKWQDNVRPDVYAQLYHDLYTLLKSRDPTCQVAIGGISQPTPLRLRYLDLILEAYQARYGEPMPVDVWNVHAFILREERDNWGVGIPPGMADRTGRLYEIADHDNMTIFRQQIVDFRRWMKERGQQEKPLIVTEYGILMPVDYGFSPQRVERFMVDTFEFFRTAIDPRLGYSADGGRLVQRWCWYSLLSARYPTGNLIEGNSGELTLLGVAYSEYSHSPP